VTIITKNEAVRKFFQLPGCSEPTVVEARPDWFTQLSFLVEKVENIIKFR
jgi:hypothetical protein